MLCGPPLPAEAGRANRKYARPSIYPLSTRAGRKLRYERAKFCSTSTTSTRRPSQPRSNRKAPTSTQPGHSANSCAPSSPQASPASPTPFARSDSLRPYAAPGRTHDGLANPLTRGTRGRASSPATGSAGDRFWGQVRGSPGRLRIVQGKRAARTETSQIAGKAHLSEFPASHRHSPNPPW